MVQNPQNVESARSAAWKARENAHAPYSKFKVGAAFQVAGESQPIAGCNVENASFSATICAERVALTSAIAKWGKPKFEFLVIVTDEPKATVPCAVCLQVLAEFVGDDFPIHLANSKGVQQNYKLRDLLPKPFRHFSVSGR